LTERSAATIRAYRVLGTAMESSQRVDYDNNLKTYLKWYINADIFIRV